MKKRTCKRQKRNRDDEEVDNGDKYQGSLIAQVFRATIPEEISCQSAETRCAGSAIVTAAATGPPQDKPHDGGGDKEKHGPIQLVRHDD